MGIDFAEIAESISRVLAIGLLLGAGLPALFAVGMRLVALSTPDEDAETATAPNQVYRYAGYFLYAVVAVVIILGILWITRQTLYHHLNIQVFPASTY
ncbi:hypothetical protein [Gordonia caeni]|uniref:Uncharacterized protein n=1 Tax=Gordonia caeni TaxID=1007097 RepID=A0ABP7NPD5_9ACTN